MDFVLSPESSDMAAGRRPEWDFWDLGFLDLLKFLGVSGIFFEI